MKYQAVFNFDVWGNSRDGWEVNDCRRGGEVEVFDTDTDAQVVAKFKCALGFTTRQVFVIDHNSDDSFIPIMRKRDGYPVGHLELVV
jgi:hypothetical protein